MDSLNTLLLGPGPSNVPPRVLDAMARPLWGHLDPRFLEVMDEIQGALRTLFGTGNRMTVPLSATGSAGMEAALANLLETGDRVVVGVAGVFGERMCDVASRIGAKVYRVDTEWGTALEAEEMIEAIARVEPKVVAFVHAETSTGVLQPVADISAAATEAGALVVLDTVTSLGGSPVDVDGWGIDVAYSGTQKCLAVPPGLSPITFSGRALEAVKERRTQVQSWYFDVSLLAGYYGSERVYHHTAPVSAIFGLAEGLRIVLEEGLEARFERHRKAGARLTDRLAAFGFEPLVAEAIRLPQLTTAVLPPSVASREAQVRKHLLEDHEIEVGGGLGPLAGRIWRIGLMGENARPEAVDRLCEALEAVLGSL